MVIFNSYVKLPEGINSSEWIHDIPQYPWYIMIYYDILIYDLATDDRWRILMISHYIHPYPIESLWYSHEVSPLRWNKFSGNQWYSEWLNHLPWTPVKNRRSFHGFIPKDLRKCLSFEVQVLSSMDILQALDVKLSGVQDLWWLMMMMMWDHIYHPLVI